MSESIEPTVTVPVGRLAEVERLVIAAAIEVCGGNKKAAAARLGISRSALYMKIARHGAANVGVPPSEVDQFRARVAEPETKAAPATGEPERPYTPPVNAQPKPLPRGPSWL